MNVCTQIFQEAEFPTDVYKMLDVLEGTYRMNKENDRNFGVQVNFLFFIICVFSYSFYYTTMHIAFILLYES